MEPQYIKNHGNWKSYTQDECYWDKTTIKITKVMEGDHENHKVHYNPRTLPKPPEQLQRLIFTFIDRCKISLNALDVSDPRPRACDLLDFMERGIIVLLQDATKLINIGCIHILFDDEVFKNELLLNYRETLGTFFSTSVNTVSQSQKAVLPELSINVTNLYYEINDHQNTSMDFLCSNFCQINDNIVTVKMMLIILQLSVVCNCFSGIAQGLKEILNHLNH